MHEQTYFHGLRGTFLILLMGCIPFLLPAQPEVEWGQEFRSPRRNVVVGVPGHVDGKTFVVSATLPSFVGPNYQNLRIARLNADMEEEAFSLIDMGIGSRSRQYENCVLFRGELYLFSSRMMDQVGKKVLYMEAIDRQTLRPASEPLAISEIPYQRRSRSGTFQFDFSRDSSFLLLHANFQVRRDEPEESRLQVYQAGMELVWEEKVRLPYQENLFSVEQFKVDNQGNAYILGVAYKEKRRSKRNGAPNYTYQVLIFPADGSDIREVSISLQDQFITDMMLEIAPNGDLVSSGFYSDRGTFSIKGAFYQRMSPNGDEVLSRSTREFGLNFITQYFNARQEKKAERKEEKGRKPEMYRYTLRDLIPRADGGSVLVAEQYFVRQVQNFNPQTNTYTTNFYYHYNDIIVVSIDPAGSIEWSSKIPKRQVSENDEGYYSSYASMITSGKLYFIYNDRIDNLRADGKTQKFKNFSLRDKNGIVVLAAVDAEGKVERKSLVSNLEIDAITRPKACVQLDRNTTFLFAKRRKTRQYGKIIF